jgi:hypothetical protein
LQNKNEIFGSSIFYSIASKYPFKKDVVGQKMFVEDLALLVMKNHLPL